MDNYIRVYDNVLTSEECYYYINLIENNPKRMGQFHNKEGVSSINSDIKLSEDINISYSFPEAAENLLKLFCNILDRYEEDISIKLNLKNCEHFVGRVYRKDKGHYNTHVDCYSKKTIGRALSILLYLNDINKGGELVFPNQNKNIEARKGRIVVFPSYWMYRHGANIPLDTDRYMIRTFMNLISNE